MVPTASGLVHPRTGKLSPAEPAHYATWRCVHRYEATADCPLWLEMVGDVFADREPDLRAAYVDLLQELAGAGLLDAKSKALSKALVLWGGQDSGKSGLIEVISGLFGDEVNTTSLTSLDGNHGTMGFIKRRPWVLYEAFNQNVWHLSSSVKTIISGEPIAINIKNGPILSQRFRAPILWATNHAPQFREATRAIVDRMVILQCRRTFEQDNPSGVALKAHRLGFTGPAELVLATEMEGVLAWALQGLRRALERGSFNVPAEAVAVGHQVRLDSNIVAEFVEDCIDFDPDAMISTADFAAAHSSWWVEHKGEDSRMPSGDSVAKALRSLGDPRIAADRVELRDMRKRYYAGIVLNEEGKLHWKNAVTADRFIRLGKTASTTDAASDPFRTIPRDWGDRRAVMAMRSAQKKGQKSSGHRRDRAEERSSSGHDDEVLEKLDGIYFP
jgi:P4 family phage/plasmid primase-like protien